MSARQQILITGGAGFIGSHLARRLVEDGHLVRVLDAFDEQVHAADGQEGSSRLPEGAELVRGDVRDPAALRQALDGIDIVYHFAAAVGVGQSMYEIHRYVDTNTQGTAALMQALAEKPVERLIVASSMSIYGEGLYMDDEGRRIDTASRVPARVRAGEFDMVDARGRPLSPVPTPETKQPHLESVYALTKYDQERLALIVGDAYGIPTVALRFFNVYGPGQALGNPYTGVLAIFATRVLNGKPPLVFEDGAQRRDFVHVDDVVRACRLALEAPDAAGHAINIGSGRSIAIKSLADEMLKVLDVEDLRPEITGKARTGDVRHCFADITLAKRLLGYEPKVSLGDGLQGMRRWLEGRAARDRMEEHAHELTARGLLA